MRWYRAVRRPVVTYVEAVHEWSDDRLRRAPASDWRRARAALVCARLPAPADNAHRQHHRVELSKV